MGITTIRGVCKEILSEKQKLVKGIRLQIVVVNALSTQALPLEAPDLVSRTHLSEATANSAAPLSEYQSSLDTLNETLTKVSKAVLQTPEKR